MTIETKLRLSSSTIRKVDWGALTDQVNLALGEIAATRGRAAPADADSPENAVERSSEVVAKAFESANARFKEVLGPLRQTMRLVQGLLLLSMASAVVGGAVAMISPWPGIGLSVVALTSMFGLLVQSWLLARDQAMLELIPDRYQLALQLLPAKDHAKLLNVFLQETSSLRARGRR
jgi:hypothetical protein